MTVHSPLPAMQRSRGEAFASFAVTGGRVRLRDLRQAAGLTIDDLGRNLNDMAKRYQKEVMVVEVGGEDNQAENTRDMLAAVLKRVRDVPEKRGLGVIYWEPQGAAAWSKYKLSCWGDDGRPTVALDAFLTGGGR